MVMNKSKDHIQFCLKDCKVKLIKLELFCKFLSEEKDGSATGKKNKSSELSFITHFLAKFCLSCC